MRDDPDTIGFRVVGELKTDPSHLLLLGDDGRWYDYDVVSGTIEGSAPGDRWAVDVVLQAATGLNEREEKPVDPISLAGGRVTQHEAPERL